MIDNILMKLSGVLSNFTALTPLILIVAGFFTSMTPCSLSSVPLVIGVLTGSGVEDSKKGFSIAVVFSLGMVSTFTILGVLSSSIGMLLAKYNYIFNLVVAGILILMSMQLLGTIQIINSKNLMSKNKRKGYGGAFISGVLAGLFSSPCATPVLVALMAMASRASNPLISIVMFVSFGIGHSIITLIAGVSVGKVWELMENPKYQNFSVKIEKIFAILILLIALVMIYTSLT